MMNKLNCNVVQDLLPNYIEGLTSDSTNKEIENHLKNCRECNRIYQDMTGGEKSFDDSNNNEKEINYLKKISRKTTKIVVGIIAAALIILAIPFTKYCIVGFNDTWYNARISVNGNELRGDGFLLSSADCVSRVRYDYDDGVVTIKVYGVLPVVKTNGDFSFDIDYTAESDIKRVQMADGRVLWEDIYISYTANTLFNDKVKYVGDNSAVSNLIDDAMVGNTLSYSGYSIHLITDKEPYGVEIYDFYPLGECTDEEVDIDIIKTAYGILANIDNADFVIFEYRAPSGPKKKFELTVDDANKKLNYDIKEKANSVKGIQMMLDDLDALYGE